MKNLKKIASVFMMLCMVISGMAVSNVSAATTLKSDTNLPFSVQRGGTYTFRITTSGTTRRPTVTVANGNALKVTFKSESGWNYFYTITAVGSEGSTSGVYMSLPGQTPIRCCIVTVAGKTIKLRDLSYVTEQSDNSALSYEDTDSKTNTGVEYDNALIAGFNVWKVGTNEEHKVYRDYLLNGGYKKLTGIFALGQNGRNNANDQWSMNVYGDGKLLYSSDPVYADVLPQTVNVDLSGVKMLRIETQLDTTQDFDQWASSTAGFFNPQLVQ